jgi:DNA repair protein RadD
MILRPYQQEAIDAVFDYWANDGGNPLIDMATGTGKSLVIAALTRRLIEQWPDLRVLMLVHVRELVAQNTQALLRAWPDAPVGINSAGLGRRDRRSQILFASIQSVAREDGFSLGERHLVLVDEAHLIPRAGNGQYLTLIGKLRERVPDLRVVGFTATPYRLDSGRLNEGEDALFDDVVFTYDIGRGVDEGFLSPLTARATGQVIDVSSVARRGGEFVAGALEAAANQDAITQAACDEICARGQDRRSWLAFCSGVAHAESVRDALRHRGVIAETVTGETPKAERDRIIQSFKAGHIRCLTNANVLTTGFDAPSVDLIAMLRPTLSTSLYVQMLGRGTRLAEGKQNCLVLDFAQNVKRHGPVDAVSVRGGKSGDGEGKVPVESVRAKVCPVCESLVGLAVYECTDCGHQWEKPKPQIEAKADRESAVMSRELVDRWLNVDSVSARVHKKEGSPDSLRVDYVVGATVYSEWICVGGKGKARAAARLWFMKVIGVGPAPTCASLSLRCINSGNFLSKILAIQVARDGAYWRVCAWKRLKDDFRTIEIDSTFNVRDGPPQEIPKDYLGMDSYRKRKAS